MMEMRPKSDSAVKDWWEDTADAFQTDRDLDIEVNWTTHEPNEINIFNDVRDADIVELGCGGGQGTVALASRGAKVTGIDISRKQLQHAQQLASQHGVSVEFIQADIHQLECLVDDAYDIALNTYVFQWIADPETVFNHVFRILRPGGKFAFAMPHPFYRVFEGGDSEPAQSYFSTGRRKLQNSKNKENSGNIITYHHTISDLVNEIIAAGFNIDWIKEPGCEDSSKYGQNSKEGFQPPLAGIVPLTLIIKAHKPSTI